MAKLIYGIHAVLAKVQHSPQQLVEVWLSKERLERSEPRLQKILTLLQQNNIDHKLKSQQEILKTCGQATHQGILAWVNGQSFQNLEQIINLMEDNINPLLLVLDGITDPHNLGACFRVAEAMGVQAIIAPKDKSAPLNAIASKIACGAAEIIPYIKVTNLARSLGELKEEGIWIEGTTLADNSIDLAEGNWNVPLAWVMGAEDKGLRQLTSKACDFLVSIPMIGYTQSLNVSVASGIVLYETLRQRSIISNNSTQHEIQS